MLVPPLEPECCWCCICRTVTIHQCIGTGKVCELPCLTNRSGTEHCNPTIHCMRTTSTVSSTSPQGCAYGKPVVHPCRIVFLLYAPQSHFGSCCTCHAFCELPQIPAPLDPPSFNWSGKLLVFPAKIGSPMFPQICKGGCLGGRGTENNTLILTHLPYSLKMIAMQTQKALFTRVPSCAYLAQGPEELEGDGFE